MGRVLKWAAIALGVLIVAAIAVVSVFDWNSVRYQVAGALSERLDRRVTIEGDLDVALSLHPRITANDVRVRNAPWAEPEVPFMGRFPRITLRLDLLPLLVGHVRFDRIELERPEVTVHRNAHGALNWSLGKPGGQAKGGAGPRIDQLILTDGLLRYVDEPQHLALIAHLSYRPGERPQNAVLQLQGRGSYRGRALSFEGAAGSIFPLPGSGPLPVSLQGKLGDNVFAVDGSLPGRQAAALLQGLSLRVEAHGPDLSRLGALADIRLPAKAYRIAGQVRHDAPRWRLDGLEARVGQSTMSGDLTYESRSGRPQIYATLNAPHLKLDELLRSLPPSKKKPERPPFAALTRFDLDARLQARQIEIGKAVIENLELQSRLEQGRLTVKPLQGGVAGGRLRGVVQIDARPAPARVDVKADIEGIQLAHLLPRNELLDATRGRVGGRVDLHGSGASIGAIRRKLEGDVALMMSGGRVDNLLVEALGLDAAETLLILPKQKGKEKPTPLRCAVAAFNVNEGIARTRALVIDTQDSTIVGDGEIDVGQERIDLQLEAKAKDPSLVAAPGTVTVKGALRKPQVDIPQGEIVERGVLALTLGVLLSPFAAILPFVEPGTQHNRDCQELFKGGLGG